MTNVCVACGNEANGRYGQNGPVCCLSCYEDGTLKAWLSGRAYGSLHTEEAVVAPRPWAGEEKHRKAWRSGCALARESIRKEDT